MSGQRLARPKPLGAIAPSVLADLMLASPFGGAVTMATLEPTRDGSILVLDRAGKTVDSFFVPAEVGSAACVRLAIAARLDPLAKGGTPEGAQNIARLRVRANEDSADLLVSVVARGDGLEAEVRALSVNGNAPITSRPTFLRRCPRCAAYFPAHGATCEQDGSVLVDVVDRAEPGGTIGQYLVGAALGEGGDGIVFRGQHAVIGKPVAIKLLRHSYANDSGAARRFLSEARVISRLRHPNVVEVTDYGLLENGQPYTVMEWVKGVPLGVRVYDGPAMDPMFALRIARAVADALGAAHDAGIVHNDLKPANVMMLEGSSEEAPRLKVLDFGAASQAGHTQDPDRLEIFGTPLYMSPELGQGSPTDARSDFYALGVLLYEMLTGDVPFDGGNPAEIVRKHAYAAVPPMVRDGNAFPPQVTRVVARCLRKSPDERPQSADELMTEIDEALAAIGRPAWRRWLP